MVRAPATSHCTHSLDRAELERGEWDTRARCCSVTLSDYFSLGTLAVCMCGSDINVCVWACLSKVRDSARVCVCVCVRKVEKSKEVHTHHIHTENRRALILLEDIMRCQNTNINLIESLQDAGNIFHEADSYLKPFRLCQGSPELRICDSFQISDSVSLCLI